MEQGVKLTTGHLEALVHVASINAHGMGAKCPTAELIEAANETERMGLMDRRLDGRWITEAGLAALSTENDDGR
jgi:hypothetical protein